ncbi:hypothetical protein JL722_5639 [Aureococcus anophagefferens]|nr:hypothetical protein JL722_5639 [Aureococcus anophagefferens]
MVKDASTSTEVAVLVDGCRIPELEDKDSPRDWDWLAWSLPEREVASVRTCPNQHQRVIATTTNDYFEVLLKNAAPWKPGDGHSKHIRTSTYVDGHLMERLIVDPDDESVIEGQDAGRIDVIVRKVRSITYDDDSDGSVDSYGYPYSSSEEDEDEDAGFAPAPDTSLAATLGNAEKKRVFGQEAAFDDEVAFGAEVKATRSKCYVDYDQDSVLATYSFRYAAIEGLQISKTNPKAWQDWQWHEIETARVASRELRKSLRGGFAVTEPPSYLFSSRLSPLEGAGAPRALCGTAGLAGYIEHVVVEELVACERFPRKREGINQCINCVHEVREDRDSTFEDEYGYLFRSAKSPIKTAKQWLELIKARRAAQGSLAAGVYDDDFARGGEAPPLVPGDRVLVRVAKGAEVLPTPDENWGLARAIAAFDYEAVVLAAGTTDSEVQVKQVEMFAQAFSNVFGVMLYLLMVSGQDKNLRVVRVMPRPGRRRVLINGVAVAHLGGAFDSIQRHHDIIEIGDESDEDEAPLPAPRKKSRTARFSKFKKEPGGVKAEVKTERPKKAPKTKKRRRK